MPLMFSRSISLSLHPGEVVCEGSLVFGIISGKRSCKEWQVIQHGLMRLDRKCIFDVRWMGRTL